MLVKTIVLYTGIDQAVTRYQFWFF